MKKPLNIPNKAPKLSASAKDAIYALPIEAQFIRAFTDSGSGFSVYKHLLVEEIQEDYQQVLAVAKAYAKEGDCRINPIVNSKAIEGRNKIYPDIEGNESPDLTTIYGYVDVKSPRQMFNTVRNANQACRQSAMVALTDLAMEEGLTERSIEIYTRKIWQDKNYTLDEVHWLVNGAIRKYNRPKENESIPA